MFAFLRRTKLTYQEPLRLPKMSTVQICLPYLLFCQFCLLVSQSYLLLSNAAVRPPQPGERKLTMTNWPRKVRELILDSDSRSQGVKG